MNVILAATENMDNITHELYTREYLNYLSVTLSYISAILLIAILIIVPLIVVIDVFYLVIPTFKNYYDTNIQGKTDMKSKIVERLLVSKNAIEAFDDASITNKPVMWHYLLRSIKFYIVVSIVVVILATGLDLILDVILKLISGVLNLKLFK